MLIIAPNGNRLLLKDASVEQIQQIEEPASTTIQTPTFNDELATTKLAQRRSAAGNGLAVSQQQI